MTLKPKHLACTHCGTVDKTVRVIAGAPLCGPCALAWVKAHA